MQQENVKTVLIIDDDQQLVLALSTFLKGHGYKIRAAYDATYGMRDCFKENVDLVILDLGLPAGGGLFILDNIKKSPQLNSLPVVVLTAKIDDGVKNLVLSRGASAYFRKPFEPAKLLETIQEILK